MAYRLRLWGAAQEASGGAVRASVEMYTDGSCLGNPGPGGWAVILRSSGIEKELAGGAAWTTNNRMELAAALAGFKALKRRTSVTVVTDSSYVRDGITRWIAGWKRRDWKNSRGDPVKNKDLWVALEAAVAAHDVSWRWVRGHSGDADNERVDRLARAQALCHRS